MLVNQTTKSLLVERSSRVVGNSQRDSAVNPKFLSRSNAFLKSKESDEFANSSRARGRNRVVSVPNTSSTNRVSSVPSPNSTTSNRSTKVAEQLLGSLAKKR